MGLGRNKLLLGEGILKARLHVLKRLKAFGP